MTNEEYELLQRFINMDNSLAGNVSVECSLDTATKLSRHIIHCVRPQQTLVSLPTLIDVMQSKPLE